MVRAYPCGLLSLDERNLLFICFAVFKRSVIFRSFIFNCLLSKLTRSGQLDGGGGGGATAKF